MLGLILKDRINELTGNYIIYWVPVFFIPILNVGLNYNIPTLFDVGKIF